VDSLVSAYRVSGQSQVSFALEHGVNVATFRSWLAKHRPETAESFCAVKVESARRDLEDLVIRLPEGMELGLRGGIEPEWLAAFVRALQG
jgi:transposase-like protein